MWHPERLVKHVHLLPRSPSECQSDDVSTTASRDTLPAPRSPLFFAARPFPSLFTGRCLDYTQLLRMKNIQCVWFIQLFIFYMILINGIAVYFAFCFVVSRAQSYITYCMILLNELIIRVRFLTNIMSQFL